MEGENLYTPPQADLKLPEPTNMLAGRWARLGASLLDSLSIAIFAVPLLYFTGGFDDIKTGDKTSLSETLVVAAETLVIFGLINTNSLLRRGQTWGKTLVGIKIVDLNGELPASPLVYVKRYVVYLMLGQFPVGGPLLSIIDVLFIFGKNRRCFHDLVAGTQVVNC